MLGSHSLKPSEKNYPICMLEFLALKWAITEKFQEYLYGTTFSIVTDNNLLTCVFFSTAKLDVTGQRWLAELSNYKCTISYRSGKHNLDADALSRIPETETFVTIFPDVLKVVCCSITVEHQQYVDSRTDADHKDIDTGDASMIKEEETKSRPLMGKDWEKA